MNRKAISTIALMPRIAASVLGLACAAAYTLPASAATVWYNTDNNFNATNGSYLFSLLTGSSCSGSACTNGITSFGIFSTANTSLNPALGYLPINPIKDTISYQQIGSNWTLTDIAGNTFTLNGSNHFLLGATMSASPGTGSWVGDSGYTTVTSGSQYIVDFPIGNSPPTQLEATDIAPIPLPAAVWLFVSGIVGMVGVARRRTRGDRSRPALPDSRPGTRQ